MLFDSLCNLCALCVSVVRPDIPYTQLKTATSGILLYPSFRRKSISLNAAQLFSHTATRKILKIRKRPVVCLLLI